MEAPGPAEGDDDSGEISDDLRFKHFTVFAQVIAWTEACLFPTPACCRYNYAKSLPPPALLSPKTSKG